MKFRSKEFLLFSCFVLYIFAMQFFHDLWRDEIHAWHIVQCSNSLSNLWQNVNYEGHPFGWFAILFLLKQISSSILLQQILHISFVIALAWIFIFRTPFHFLLKVFILFGYYFAYEYGIIQRPYAPSIFILFLVVDFIIRGKKLLWIYPLLFVAAALQSQAFIIASGLLFYLFLRDRYQRKKIWLLHILFILVFAILFYIDVKPHAENADIVKEINFSWNSWIHSANLFSKGVFIYTGVLEKWFGAFTYIFSFLLIVFLPAFVFYKKDKALAVSFVATCFAFYIFWFLFFNPYYRQSGFIWITVLIWTWFYISKNKKSYVQYILYPIAFVHLLLGIKNISYDIKHRQSAIESCARFLSKNVKKDWLGIGYVDYMTEPIFALNKLHAYYPQQENYHDFVRWTLERNIGFNGDELRKKVQVLQSKEHKTIYLISNKEVRELRSFLWEKFDYPFIKNEERYFLYLFTL